MLCEEDNKLTFSKYGRFCHEVKINYSPYVNYFTRVYWNRSYFVYKVNTVISFQSWEEQSLRFRDYLKSHAGFWTAWCPAGGVDVGTAAAPTPAADSWVFGFVRSRSDVTVLVKCQIHPAIFLTAFFLSTWFKGFLLHHLLVNLIYHNIDL